MARFEDVNEEEWNTQKEPASAFHALPDLDCVFDITKP